MSGLTQYEFALALITAGVLLLLARNIFKLLKLLGLALLVILICSWWENDHENYRD